MAAEAQCDTLLGGTIPEIENNCNSLHFPLDTVAENMPPSRPLLEDVPNFIVVSLAVSPS